MDALEMLMDPMAAPVEETPAVATPAKNDAENNNKPAHVSRFVVSDKGVFLKNSTDDAAPEKFEFVCGKLDVVAQIRDRHSGQWGKLLQWQDPDRVFHEWAMPMAELQGDGSEVRRELAAGGLEISQTRKGRTSLVGYLSETKTDLRARGVEKTGWHRCNDGSVFVLPEQTIGESSEVVRFQSETASSTYTVGGTANGWRSKVAALCAGNSRCVLALSTGFASMLLEFSGLDSGGIHLKGSSSTGKTTALAAAASIFGGPDYINGWKATANGLESLAALHNSCLLILNEIAQVDPREAGEAAYMLANGQGKQRSARTGGAKRRQSWRLLFLSDGEIGLAQHMAEGGKKIKAGQEVRLVDLDADAGQGLGVFDTLHGYPDGAELSTAIRTGATQHHGHAVLAFAKVLSDAACELPELVKREMGLFTTACLPDAKTGGQAHRVCERFALIAMAGELASTNGVTGWKSGEALSAAKRCFLEWLGARGGASNTEPGAIIEAVRGFISKHEEARFTDLNPDPNAMYRATINRAGWRRKVGEAREYYVDPTVFKTEVCAGFDVTAACKVLVDAGCLESATESGKTRYSMKRHIEGEGHRRVYVVNAKIWGA